jgi:hypothetical protein
MTNSRGKPVKFTLKAKTLDYNGAFAYQRNTHQKKER